MKIFQGKTIGLLFILLMIQGCVQPWTVLRESGPPSALVQPGTVSVTFDYSEMLVGHETEEDWVARKSTEDPEYPTTFENLKTTAEDYFLEGFYSKIKTPNSRVDADGDITVVIKFKYLQMGKYMVVAATATSVKADIIWSRNGEVVDEIAVTCSVPATMTTPSVHQHMKPRAKTLGLNSVGYLEFKQKPE